MELTEHAIIPPAGYRATGVRAGIKKNGNADFALIVSDREASAAGVFTTNRVFAAPVTLNREHLKGGKARAIVVNAGNANACTGEPGLEDARTTAKMVGAGLDIPPQEVLVNSTGVIGVRLPMAAIEKGVTRSIEAAVVDGWDAAAEAIMTTDTVPKKASATLEIAGKKVTIAGITKGAGMIAPNMATMLGFVCTDAGVAPDKLKEALVYSVNRSFNNITVDGDMSTNDTVLVMANDAAGTGELQGDDFIAFRDALSAVCESLARQIARDGEGATKLITIHVTGAASEQDARTVGLSVANSNLVKTAVFGRDPNWGRILCAVGYAGVDIHPERIRVSMAGIPIFADGGGLAFDRKGAIEALGAENIDIDIALGDGSAEAVIYTCDFTYDYVRINAEYTT